MAKGTWRKRLIRALEVTPHIESEGRGCRTFGPLLPCPECCLVQRGDEERHPEHCIDKWTKHSVQDDAINIYFVRLVSKLLERFGFRVLRMLNLPKIYHVFDYTECFCP
jgi:hypothetical protein